MLEWMPAGDISAAIANNEKFGTFSFYGQLLGKLSGLPMCATIQGLRTMRQTSDMIIPHHPIWASLDVGYLRRFTGLAPSLRLRTSRSWPISQSRRRSAFQSRWASPEAQRRQDPRGAI